MEKMDDKDFPNHGTIENGAQINGNVHVGRGSQISKDVVLKGPTIIGENCVLKNCIIGPCTSLGSGCDINGARIEDSIILDNAEIDTDLFIKDSIIGKNVKFTKKSSDDGRSMVIGDKTIIEH
ncbi:hypothetical protein HOF40_03350 [Candidatus Parcubacteria bacterium]|nr:hypothetical protein [Candidatus Parcubacteria bacterium]